MSDIFETEERDTCSELMLWYEEMFRFRQDVPQIYSMRLVHLDCHFGAMNRAWWGLEDLEQVHVKLGLWKRNPKLKLRNQKLQTYSEQGEG